MTGVEWPVPPPRTSRSSKEPHSESDLEDYDEELESDEEYTDDEEVPGFSIFISKLFNDLKKNHFFCACSLVSSDWLGYVPMSGENEVAGHDATSAPEPVKSGMSDTPSIPVAAAQRPLQETAVVAECLSPPSVTPEPKGQGCEG